MNLPLSEAERQQLRALQKQRRDEAGYGKAPVRWLLGKGRSVAGIAEDLGLDEGTGYRCARLYRAQGLEKYLAAGPARVYVVCGNARHYKNQALALWLADKPIRQVFLPPCSPNPNPIERRWQFLRQKITSTTFHRAKGAFTTAGLRFFDRLPEFGPEPASRLTLKFPVLDPQPTS